MAKKVTDPALLAQLETRVDPRMQQRLNTRQAAAQSWEDASGFERFGVGIAKPFVETWKGLKDLVGIDLSDEEIAELERLQEVKGAAGTTGQIVGELATLAIPAGGALKGVRAASQGPKLIRALAAMRGAPLAAESATVGLMESLKAPTDERSRGDAFVQGAAGTVAGAGAGRLLKRALGGLAFREGAEELLQKGVKLTPGQAGGRGLQAVENAVANVPVIGTPIRRLQQTAVTDWNRDVLSKIMPEELASRVTKGGNEGFEQATKAFSDAYETLFRGSVKPDTSAVNSAALLADQATGGAKEILDQFAVSLQRERIPGSDLSWWDDQLRKYAVAASRRGDVAEKDLLNEARTVLKDAIPDDMAAQWKKLDSAFRNFATARKAGTYQGAAKNRGVFTPAELLRASGAQDKSAGKRAFAQGQAALQEEALDAGDMLQVPARGIAEQLSFPVGVGALMLEPTIAATGYAGSRLAVNEGTRKFMIALQRLITQGQQPTKEMVEKLEKEYGLTAGTLGAAITEAMQ